MFTSVCKTERTVISEVRRTQNLRHQQQQQHHHQQHQNGRAEQLGFLSCVVTDMDGGDMKISFDRLPIKRLDAIEENGLERFPREIGRDEERLALIRRIDFTPVVENDSKKQKSSSSKEPATATIPWPWQSLVENLQLAHQELSVIIDLINTVEANDAVTVACMTRPKQLPNELLSDLAVSAATKLQSFRNLGKYFRQSAKALEQQVTREARFYGALIRLQQNWKVKRQRLGASTPGGECFTIDLFDNSLLEPTALFRPPISTVHVDHDSAGMLTVKMPSKSCHSIQFGFLGGQFSCTTKFNKSRKNKVGDDPPQEAKKAISDEEVAESIEEVHSVLRELHRAIFEEQVFDLVNREAFYPTPGVNVIGIRENFLQFGIGQEASVFLSLVSEQDSDQMVGIVKHTENGENGLLPLDVIHSQAADEQRDAHKINLCVFLNPTSFKMYLQQILHENVFVRSKEKFPLAARTQASGLTTENVSGLLGHFCMTLAHRIFANKVLAELENLVSGIPYLHLLSHPTWHSRASSWSLSVKVPESILHSGHGPRSPDMHDVKNKVRSQFLTKVVVNDECISVSGEGAPDVVGFFRGRSMDIFPMNHYDCDLADLPVILLQQVASQVIRWLHEEALLVGMKATSDFISLSFELEQGDKLALVAHVDPDVARGCISWWLVMEGAMAEEGKLFMDFSNGGSENRKFLGHLSLQSLYCTLMDLVSLCNSGIH